MSPIGLVSNSTAISYDKYSTLNLPPSQAIEKRAIATEAASGINNAPAPSSSFAEAVLAEARGVILGVEGEYVKVKLYPNTHANFPAILFIDHTFIKRGQHIKYLLKRDREGFRYQELIPDTNVPTNPQKDSLLALLNEVKKRDE